MAVRCTRKTPVLERNVTYINTDVILANLERKMSERQANSYEALNRDGHTECETQMEEYEEINTNIHHNEAKFETQEVRSCLKNSDSSELKERNTHQSNTSREDSVHESDGNTTNKEKGPHVIKVITYINIVLMAILYVTATALSVFVVITEKDGGWASWGLWSECSQTCDGGFHIRERTCSNPVPTITGKYCDGNTIDVKTCNYTPCTDGRWSLWGNWEKCSTSCGIGIRSRIRSCTNPSPSALGRYCDGVSDETEICKHLICPENKIAFQAWGIANTSDETRITFPNVNENHGDAYSTASGRFTCPTSGIYYFAVVLSFKMKSTDHCFLNINSSDNIRTLTIDKPDPDELEFVSLQGIIAGSFYLNRQDTVFIDNCSYEQVRNSMSTSFTGVLVTPDL